MKLKGFYVSLVVILSASVFYFVADEDINPEIPLILEEFESHVSTQNNANVYRLGMWIAYDKSPYDAGLEIIESYEAAVRDNGGKIADLEFKIYPLETMALNEEEDSLSPLLCNLEHSDCINFIWSNTERIQQLTSQYGEYIERLDGLIELSEFKLFLSPSYMVPQIQAGEDIFALKLKLLEIIAFYRTGNQKMALNELSKLLRFYNNELEATRYVMPKAVSLVSSIILVDVISFLISKTESSELKNWRTVINEIPPMTSSQLSMENTLLHEFVIFAKAENEIHTTEGNSLPWYIKYIPKSLSYKPNMTKNLFLEEIRKGVNTVSLENGMIKVRELQKTRDLSEQIQLKNIIGSMLVYTAIPKYINVELDLFLLDLKKSLLRKVFSIKSEGETRIDQNSLNFLNPLTTERVYVKDEDRLCIPDRSNSDICIFI